MSAYSWMVATCTCFLHSRRMLSCLRSGYMKVCPTSPRNTSIRSKIGRPWEAPSARQISASGGVYKSRRQGKKELIVYLTVAAVNLDDKTLGSSPGCLNEVQENRHALFGTFTPDTIVPEIGKVRLAVSCTVIYYMMVDISDQNAGKYAKPTRQNGVRRPEPASIEMDWMMSTLAHATDWSYAYLVSLLPPPCFDVCWNSPMTDLNDVERK